MGLKWAFILGDFDAIECPVFKAIDYDSMEMDKQILIQYVRSLVDMTLDEAVELTERFQYKKFKKKEFLLTEGKTSQCSHFIAKGVCRAFLYDFNGVDTTLSFFTGPSFANDVHSLFNRVRSVENIQAITDVETWFLEREDIEYNFHNIPKFREVGRAMLVKSCTKAKSLYLDSRRHSAEERYLKLIQESEKVIKYASLKHIASYIGVTESSLSRIRRNLG